MNTDVPRLALTYAEAATASGYSKRVIQLAVEAGDIAPSYANSKPVIRVDELRRWLETLPTERRA